MSVLFVFTVFRVTHQVALICYLQLKCGNRYPVAKNRIGSIQPVHFFPSVGTAIVGSEIFIIPFQNAFKNRGILYYRHIIIRQRIIYPQCPGLLISILLYKKVLYRHKETIIRYTDIMW